MWKTFLTVLSTFCVHLILQSKYKKQMASVNSTVLSMFKFSTLVCSPNFYHEYLGFPELPRKVIIFKITAMNSAISQHESIAVLIQK